MTKDANKHQKKEEPILQGLPIIEQEVRTKRHVCGGWEALLKIVDRLRARIGKTEDIVEIHGPGAT